MELFVKQRLHLALVGLWYFWFSVQHCSECNFPWYQPFDRKELSPEQPLYQLWDNVCFLQVPFMSAALWNTEKNNSKVSPKSVACLCVFKSADKTSQEVIFVAYFHWSTSKMMISSVYTAYAVKPGNPRTFTTGPKLNSQHHVIVAISKCNNIAAIMLFFHLTGEAKCYTPVFATINRGLSVFFQQAFFEFAQNKHCASTTIFPETKSCIPCNSSWPVPSNYTHH